MLSLLTTLFWMVMPWVGLVAVIAGLGFLIAPKLPYRFSKRLVEWHLGKAFSIMGPEICLVRTTDNKYTLSRAEYDAENGVLWVDYGNVLKGYDANGDGLKSLPFLASNLWLVYEDLGAVLDIVSAEIGRQALANYSDHHQETIGASINSVTGQPALADGGDTVNADDLDKHEIIIPSSGVVADLRNAIHFAPFNVQPAAFKRVERNAKAGLQGFSNWGPIAQTGGMLGAFFMGALVAWWVGGGGGGDGGGSADVVPMLVDVSLMGLI